MKSLLPFLLSALPFLLPSLSALPDEVIQLTPQEFEHLGIETIAAQPGDFEVTVFALARIEAMPEKRSVLSSRISGRVLENEMRIGTYVEKGQKLVQLEARQPGSPPPAVWLTAPANGTILAVNAVLGAPVEPSERLAEIAELNQVYLIATVPQATAGSIRQGTQARVRIPLRPDKTYMATLLKYAACPCPDPACALGQDMSMRSGAEERQDRNSAGVVFLMENPDNQLRPGMNAECSIVIEQRKGVLAVPRDALQEGSIGHHVFVAQPGDSKVFRKVAVRTGMSSDGRVEILEGLKAGDAVVTKGSYLLGHVGKDGASLKDALDAAHGHEHNADGSEKDPGHGDHPHEDHADHAHDEPAGHAHDAHRDHAHDESAGHAHDAHADHAHDAHADHAHDDHADPGRGGSTREIVLLGVAAFFAVLWVLGILRRNHHSSTSKKA